MKKKIWFVWKLFGEASCELSYFFSYTIKRFVAFRLIISFFVIWAGGLLLSFLLSFSLNGTIDYVIVLFSKFFNAMGYPESLHWKNFSILSCLLFTTLLLWLVVSYGWEKKENSDLYSNLPTEGREKIISSFLEENPVIDRTADVHGFIQKITLLDPNKRNVMALDGKWGCGKSTFVGHVILLKTLMFDDEAKRWGVDYEDHDLPDLGKWKKLREQCITICKKSKERDDSEDGKINLSLTDEYLYYDAWKNDAFVGEPILSILYTIFPKEVRNLTKKQSEGILQKIATPLEFVANSILLPGAVQKMINGFILVCKLCRYEAQQHEKEFADMEQYDRLHKEVKKLIDLSSERQNKKRFVIFIDELDRCNPLFAMRVLERVKHFFDNKKLVFVFSVNLEQLQHTIKKVYGHDFDAIHYLHRFFTEQVELPHADTASFIESEFENE